MTLTMPCRWWWSEMCMCINVIVRNKDLAYLLDPVNSAWIIKQKCAEIYPTLPVLYWSFYILFKRIPVTYISAFKVVLKLTLNQGQLHLIPMHMHKCYLTMFTYTQVMLFVLVFQAVQQTRNIWGMGTHY